MRNSQRNGTEFGLGEMNGPPSLVVRPKFPPNAHTHLYTHLYTHTHTGHRKSNQSKRFSLIYGAGLAVVMRSPPGEGFRELTVRCDIVKGHLFAPVDWVLGAGCRV